ELTTLLQVPQVNTDPALQAELVVAPYALWGVSDGGSHTKFIPLGAYPTESLIDFVRERNLVTLEEAHWRLSALPARAAGFRDRRTLGEGAPAERGVRSRRQRHAGRGRAGRHRRLRLGEPPPPRRGGGRGSAGRRMAPHSAGR